MQLLMSIYIWYSQGWYSGSDVIQHLKIDLERLSEVIIKSYFISEL